MHPRARSGAPSGAVLAAEDSVVSARDLVVSTADGGLEVRNAATLALEPPLPSVIGLTNGLWMSDDGTRVLVVGRDRTLHLDNLPTRTQIGDAISMGDGGDPTAYLRRDGQALAFSDARGIVVWDLSPQALLRGACQVAGRDITEAEWNANVIGLGPYRSVCPRA